MVDPNKLSRKAPAAVPKAMAVLERVRDSYQGLLEPNTLSGADQAVLAAVELALKQLAKAS